MGAWWVPLFEKAYAKFNQNYERIQGGSGFEGLKVLTGMPVQYYPFDKLGDLEIAWNKFSSFTNKNYAMTTPCCTVANPDGLHSAHAYSFLGAFTLDDGTRLAKIRNPWGRTTYKGPWNNEDSRWTAANKKKTGYTEGNDGIFFTPYKYWLKYFRQLNVAYYQNYASVTHKNFHMAQKKFVF